MAAQAPEHLGSPHLPRTKDSKEHPEHAACRQCSLHMSNLSNVNTQIARQIFIALQRRGADKLMSIIESYGDTLSDAEMLQLLQEYNLTGRTSHPRR
jgi:hypothetical protein